MESQRHIESRQRRIGIREQNSLANLGERAKDTFQEEPADTSALVVRVDEDILEIDDRTEIADHARQADHFAIVTSGDDMR